MILGIDTGTPKTRSRLKVQLLKPVTKTWSMNRGDGQQKRLIDPFTSAIHRDGLGGLVVKICVCALGFTMCLPRGQQYRLSCSEIQGGCDGRPILLSIWCSYQKSIFRLYHCAAIPRTTDEQSSAFSYRPTAE